MNIRTAQKASWISNGSIRRGGEKVNDMSKWIKTIWVKFSLKYAVWKIKEEKYLAKCVLGFTKPKTFAVVGEPYVQPSGSFLDAT